MTGTTAVDADEAQRLRDAMTDKLMKVGRITSPAIEAAFRTVPRHAFARPGTPLEECYHGDIVRNKKDADGVTLSSISSAWLQARMIAQAGVSPGARVLEIGATGYNAAVSPRSPAPAGTSSPSTSTPRSPAGPPPPCRPPATATGSPS